METKTEIERGNQEDFDAAALRYKVPRDYKYYCHLRNYCVAVSTNSAASFFRAVLENDLSNAVALLPEHMNIFGLHELIGYVEIIVPAWGRGSKKNVKRWLSGERKKDKTAARLKT